MADKLLVRTYNVELGDCIYCRIPKGKRVGSTIDDFHILIDCGSLGAEDLLETAVTDLESILPSAGAGKKRLDLLVVTHEHRDHIAGFNPAFFQHIEIGHIWMNTAMDPAHPQADLAFRLRQLATTAMRNLAGLNLSLTPELEELVALYGIENGPAMDALRTTLPTNSNITAKYVHAGMTKTQLGFAFAEISNKVTNNTSLVLLIQWKGKRLLFVGDAEWNTKFKEGKQNGAWNVMWHERKHKLDSPIDFLKIGHHGSENATPWSEDGTVTEPSTILDSILPIPPAGAPPTAKAVVSTKRKNFETIPRAALLVELGKRVQGVNYKQALGANASSLPKFTAFEKNFLNSPQPLRTDCEQRLTGVAFVDVEIEA